MANKTIAYEKLYTLLFCCLWLLGFSQSHSSQLTSVVWKVTKIQWNNSDYYAPPPFLNGGTLYFFDQNRIASNFYNSSGGNFSFGENNANYFNLKNMHATLGVYYGENEQAVQKFDGMTTHFYMYFQDNDKFFFDYQESESGKGLVITNPNGDKIFYTEKILSTSEISKSKISVYPNPATDYIVAENLKINSNIELIDNSGKLVKTISNKSSREEINIKNLIPGIYYLKADGKLIQKIIKK